MGITMPAEIANAIELEVVRLKDEVANLTANNTLLLATIDELNKMIDILKKDEDAYVMGVRHGINICTAVVSNEYNNAKKEFNEVTVDKDEFSDPNHIAMQYCGELIDKLEELLKDV